MKKTELQLRAAIETLKERAGNKEQWDIDFHDIAAARLSILVRAYKRQPEADQTRILGSAIHAFLHNEDYGNMHPFSRAGCLFEGAVYACRLDPKILEFIFGKEARQA